MLDEKYKDSPIYRRHSTRKYAAGDIAPAELEHMLHAGMAAPSAHNTQPWEFVVVDDRKLLEAIAEFHPYGKMMRQAALAIVPCVRKSVAMENPFYPQDLGAAVENILIAATECGLGSCWCGIHPKPDLEKAFAMLLGLPDTVFAFAVIAIGRAEGPFGSSDRYDAARVHRNAW